MAMIEASRRALEHLVLPELRQIPPHERAPAMKRAGEEPFELLEWAGILLGLVLTVSVTRYSTSDLKPGARLALVCANFLVAIPVLTVLVGPFVVRCRRRGLRSFMRERSRVVNWRPAE
jgi:hypothetical protein